MKKGTKYLSSSSKYDKEAFFIPSLSLFYFWFVQKQANIKNLTIECFPNLEKGRKTLS
jgi:hypothetical protein